MPGRQPRTATSPSPSRHTRPIRSGPGIATNTPRRDFAGRWLKNGSAGPLGLASAAVRGDVIVVDMVCSGSRIAKVAAQRGRSRPTL